MTPERFAPASDPLAPAFRAPPLDAHTIHVWLLPHAGETTRQRALLAAYAGVSAVELAPALHGKPRLARGDLEFNLSHSGAHALLALARGTPVGVDLERRERRVAREAALIARCFDVDEAAAIARAEDPRDALLRAWCAKEALVKAIGRGIAYGLRRVRLTWADGEPRLAALEGPASASGPWRIAMLDPAPGYRAALAYAGASRGIIGFRC